MQPEPIQEAKRFDLGAIHAAKTHCPKGHPYSGDNLYIPPGRKERHCRTCQREQRMERTQRRQEERENAGFDPGPKVCRDCGKEKAPSEFYVARHAADGLRPCCKSCDRAASKEWSRLNPSKARAKRERHRARHPEKARARWTLHSAVAEGRIVKADACEDCGVFFGDARKLHGHHEDYSKPLEVAWLCKDCHAARHRTKEGINA